MAYDCLVAAGPSAQFKGVATINGSGESGFLLTATDGQVNGGNGVDKFRIKIWNRASDQVIYDNQMDAADDADPTTVIGGGAIVIHKLDAVLTLGWYGSACLNNLERSLYATLRDVR